ncbi:hypothetical protein KXV52_006443, partial [Aspergillus fumigatus]
DGPPNRVGRLTIVPNDPETESVLSTPYWADGQSGGLRENPTPGLLSYIRIPTDW